MADETKKGLIKEILKAEYKNKLTEDVLNRFTDDIYLSLFVEQYDLDDIFAIVSEYEEKANLDNNAAYNLFEDLIDLLDDNENTANRLYTFFMENMEDLYVCVKLLRDNDEYLSADKLAQVKERAFSIFDCETLAIYGIAE